MHSFPNIQEILFCAPIWDFIHKACKQFELIKLSVKQNQFLKQ